MPKKPKKLELVKTNPLFGKFDQVVKAVARSEKQPQLELGDYWGDKSALTYADLFCGIGGFHQAADELGLKCVFACDIDKEARKAYEHNYGITPEGDVSRLQMKNVPDFDILFAGFPCQPFSIIGNREGFGDARGTLFFDIAKILKAKKPKAFVLENVKQLVSHNKGKTFERIIEILEDELGYDVEYQVLNAKDFGLPQKRERVFIVGFRDSAKPFEFPSGDKKMKPLSDILEKKPDERHYVSERIRKSRHTKHKAKKSPMIWHENKSGNVSSHPFSCALRAGASYNYLLVDGERRLSPREMLRLQGFPDSFEIVCNDSQTRKQAGNAVPVPIVKAILEKVIYAEQNQTERATRAA
ncbi:MAG: DNA (cytosine-5-)-methyltransferase [Acidobacteria bacterium]|nr:MAG: DNA (cytosine-5-)-methyltransferase [Acidobacteriota bacterium]REJ98019.1 MAG: DNA (cytosine-5-)-methyltransferase [Acidobacteriota bacterium]REK16762.1 MAG: DNA (cytosine-5-)-methyltransferase [Acidobacteriota bacterium]REK42673.1 MAG: DNA (cytosine-5-)-methyltransferase [Acidobacteriota bacterium]